jgi:hypothetical protein
MVMVPPIFLQTFRRFLTKSFAFDSWLVPLMQIIGVILLLLSCAFGITWLIIHTFQTDDQKCTSVYGRNWDHQVIDKKAVCINSKIHESKPVLP